MQVFDLLSSLLLSLCWSNLHNAALLGRRGLCRNTQARAAQEGLFEVVPISSTAGSGRRPQTESHYFNTAGRWLRPTDLAGSQTISESSASLGRSEPRSTMQRSGKHGDLPSLLAENNPGARN